MKKQLNPNFGQWISPAGQAQKLIQGMLQQPHLLIAGSTGSGKSVLIHTMIWHMLFQMPEKVRIVLIDPKRVELSMYKHLPHCAGYASDVKGIIGLLNGAVNLMEQRYMRMERAGLRKSIDADMYIIIDEFADLMITAKKEVTACVTRLTQLGRAANIHVIAATQRPTRDIINGAIKVNFDSRIALRCPTAQDSRNIVNMSGAEKLPRYGKGIYMTPDETDIIDILMIPHEELTERINWWACQKPFSKWL